MLMLHLSNIRWIFLYLLVVPLYLHHTVATWPSTNATNIYLMGLFADADNASLNDTTTSSIHSRAMFQAAIVLSQQLNITIDGQLIGWKSEQTGGKLVTALHKTCDEMTVSNIIGIVGPAFSREAPVIAAISESIGIPTISYAATAPTLSDRNTYPTFHRTIPSDNTAALAIGNLFLRYNWTSSIIIYQNDDFGTGGMDITSKIFTKNNLAVTATLLYDISTLSFRDDLKTTLLGTPTRIVILWAEQLHATSILQLALDNNVLGPEFLWIVCANVTLNSFNPNFYPQLVGLLTIAPTIASSVDANMDTTLLNSAYNIWQQYEPETFPGTSNIDDYALFSFDATWTFILALQKLCSSTYNNTSCLSIISSSSCFERHFSNTDSYIDIIKQTNFLGVSGMIQFSNDTTDRIKGNYYIVKNVQSSGNKIKYIPVLQWSDSGEWDATTQGSSVIWPGGSITPPTGLPSLTGVTVRIGVLLQDPFTMPNQISDEFGQNTTKYNGYAPDLIDLLQTKLRFTPIIEAAPLNATYDDMIAGIINNVYDIVVADITITAERREIVDFSSTIFDNSLRIIVRESTSVKLDLLSYLKPFSLRVWIVILGALLYSALLFFLLERRENEALKDKSNVSSAAMSVWYSFSTILGYGVDFNVQTAAGRLLTMGIYILSMILVASYTANLTSNLTLSRSQTIISSIDDIKNGKIAYSRIGILVGSSVEEYYLREISQNSRNFYPLHSMSEMYSGLLDDVIDAGIMDTGILEYATRTTYCNLTLVGAGFDPSAFGIVMRKGWVYGQALDIAILSIRESGDLDNLKRKWFQGAGCSDSSLDVITDSTTIEALAGLFVTFAVISILSLLLFVWLKRSVIRDYISERIIHRKQQFTDKDHTAGSLQRENYNNSLQHVQVDLDPSYVTGF